MADIEILALGKECIHYKITKRLGLRRVGAQVSSIAPMENYLRINQATLVKGSCQN